MHMGGQILGGEIMWGFSAFGHQKTQIVLNTPKWSICIAKHAKRGIGWRNHMRKCHFFEKCTLPKNDASTLISPYKYTFFSFQWLSPEMGRKNQNNPPKKKAPPKPYRVSPLNAGKHDFAGSSDASKCAFLREFDYVRIKCIWSPILPHNPNPPELPNLYSGSCKKGSRIWMAHNLIFGH